MEKLKFKCTLLSDVILNMKSATTGPNETLDFIPGGNFLGIVAAELYPVMTSEESWLLFHSGKVRFGDAHPSQGGVRGLKAPASMFYPKLSAPEKELYIHHLIPSGKDMTGLQLKQCRSGFYVFPQASATDVEAPQAVKVSTFTDFAIKSAYDRRQRRSKDEQLFGYQSLRSGLTMYFSVEFDDAAVGLAGKVRKALEKKNRIGRSRSAQYGLVEIESADYIEEEGGMSMEGERKDLVAVYADSRLIFLDGFGMPTFQPTARQLGLEGEIDWEKSQVRTFRYAPWNFKRQSFDTDRCGIEKGSVLVVRLPEGYAADLRARTVGSYVNEGFGRVIYNPSFLRGDAEGNALCRLAPPLEGEPTSAALPAPATPLISYLRARKEEEKQAEKLYVIVNRWVADNARKFSGADFASQWGTIRGMAASAESLGSLVKELLEERPVATGYLVHGVAKDKWNKERLTPFRTLLTDTLRRSGLNDAMARMAVVNIAAEMAKKCR